LCDKSHNSLSEGLKPGKLLGNNRRKYRTPGARPAFGVFVADAEVRGFAAVLLREVEEFLFAAVEAGEGQIAARQGDARQFPPVSRGRLYARAARGRDAVVDAEAVAAARRGSGGEPVTGRGRGSGRWTPGREMPAWAEGAGTGVRVGYRGV
jgi:hypothetical protein